MKIKSCIKTFVYAQVFAWYKSLLNPNYHTFSVLLFLTNSLTNQNKYIVLTLFCSFFFFLKGILSTPTIIIPTKIYKPTTFPTRDFKTYPHKRRKKKSHYQEQAKLHEDEIGTSPVYLLSGRTIPSEKINLFVAPKMLAICIIAI